MEDQLVPELRFKEFEGEWIGFTISKVASKVNSGSTPRGGEKVYVDDGIPFIRSQNVLNDSLNIDDASYISPEVHQQMNNSAVLPNDVLLNITGGSIGRSCVVPLDTGEANVNQHVCIIRLKKNFSPQIVQYFLSSHKGQKEVYRNITGSGREGLNFQGVRSFRTPLPSLPEQQKIASFLTLVERRLAAARRRVKLLEEWKRGVMQELFQNLEKWPSTKLGNIADVQKGKGISKSDITEDGHTPCVRYGELYTTYGEVIETVKSRTDVSRAELLFSQGGEVLVPASGETAIGIATAACILPSDIALGSDINIITTHTDGRFLAYQLSGPRKLALARLAQGVSVMHIYGKQLKEIVVFVPDTEEQTRIATTLTTIDARITAAQQEVRGWENWKRGLLQKLLV
jgi:type I restriction enzyme S subunit